MIPQPLLAPMTIAELGSAASKKMDPQMKQLLDALASLGAMPVKTPAQHAPAPATSADVVEGISIGS